jgi:hypothetical protein
MTVIIGFILLCFDLGGLLALGRIECGWKVPLFEQF